MARLALSAAGAGIGFALGGPMGARIGWVAGSLAGAALIPSKLKSEGPRLQDLSVQVSQEGVPIPLVYGTVRISGNVIWSSGIVETKTIKKTSAKGGKTKTTDTQYYYHASFAVLLADNEIDGITRIWADGTLIYNSTAGDADELTSIVAGVLTAQRQAPSMGAGQITVYPGTETQEADPTIQAYEGSANTPAFLGRAYVVFADMPLSAYGNRIPQLSIEVVNNGSINTAPRVVKDWGTWPVNYEYAGAAIENGTIVATDTRDSTSTRFVCKFLRYDLAGNVIGQEVHDNPYPAPLTGNTGTYTATIAQGDPRLGKKNIRVSGDAQEVWMVNGELKTTTIRDITGVRTNWSTDWPVVIGDYVYAAQYAYHGLSVVKFKLRDGLSAFPSDFPEPQQYLNFYDEGILSSTAITDEIIVIKGDDGCLYATPAGNTPSYKGVNWHDLFKLDLDTLEILDYWDLSSGDWQRHQAVIDGSLCMRRSVANTIMIETLNNDHTMTLVNSITAYSDVTSDHMRPLGRGLCLTNRRYSPTQTAIFSMHDALAPDSITLANIESDLMDRAGMDAADYDVSALTDTVDGYLVASQMAARSAIEPLQAAFPHDIIETDGQLVAIKRGTGSSIASLSVDDVVTDGSAPIEKAMQQDFELPRSLTVRYIDLDQDQQVGAQSARRMIEVANHDASYDLSVVMTSAKAGQVADYLLANAWMERVKLQFTLPPKYLRVNPSDLVTLTADDGALLCRITRADIGGGNSVSCEAVVDNAAAYASTAVGNDTNTDSSQSLSLRGPMNLAILDLPPLRDMDNTYAVYAAASGFYADWPGGVVMRSADGVTYDDVLAIDPGATMGYCTAALGDNGWGNRWDITSSVNVAITTPDAALSSTTRDSIYAGANAAIIGNEVVQFLDVVEEADGTYTLTNFLRGRKDTPHTGHEIGERFILLDTSVTGFGVDALDFGVARSYKGTTYDSYPDEVGATSFTFGAERLKPRAPVLAKASLSSAYDWVIEWTPSVRLYQEMIDGREIPIDEGTETYALDIYDTGGNLLRTVTVTSATCTYTFAEQIEDGATYGWPEIDIDIYQVSSRVGRGYAYA